MFRSILTILTATTFVAHGLFGCCWHHGHAHEVSHVDGVKFNGVKFNGAKFNGAKQGHCHDHSHHGHDVSDEHGQNGNHDSHSPVERECEGDHCVFARTQDGPQLSGDFLMACAASLVEAITDGCLQSPTGESSAIAAQSRCLSLSAPVCALSQLWLI